MEAERMAEILPDNFAFRVGISVYGGDDYTNSTSELLESNLL